MGRTRQERKAFKKARKKQQYIAHYGKRVKKPNNNVNPKISKMCFSKIRYLSYTSAIKNCIYYSTFGKTLNVYHCPNCHQWHITSHEKR